MNRYQTAYKKVSDLLGQEVTEENAIKAAYDLNVRAGEMVTRRLTGGDRTGLSANELQARQGLNMLLSNANPRSQGYCQGGLRDAEADLGL